MPDPKHYTDSEYQYVKGHVRRRQRRLRLDLLTLLVIFVGVAVYVLLQIWFIVAAVIGLALLIYILRHQKQWRHRWIMWRLRRMEEDQQRRTEEGWAKERMAEMAETKARRKTKPTVDG